MPTTKRRIWFTPSDEALENLDRIAAASGVSTSALVAELIGRCEPRLQDMAACLDQLEQIKAELADDLAGKGHWAMQMAPPLGDLEWKAEQECRDAILAAQQRVDQAAQRFAKHITKSDPAPVLDLEDWQPIGAA